MYELTCPSCGHVMKTPFARTGAMATCAGCKHAFSVNAETTRRVGSPPAAQEPLITPEKEPAPTRAAAALLPPPSPSSPPAPTPTPQQAPRPKPAAKPAPLPLATQGPSVGGIDLLDDDEEEEADEAPVFIPSTKRSRSHHQTKLKRNQKHRQRGPVLVLAGVVVALIVVISIGIYLNKPRLASILDAKSGKSGQASSSSLPDLTLIQPERVQQGTWLDAAVELHVPMNHTGAIKLENLETRPTTDGAIFRADVVASNFDLIESATLKLAMVDESNKTYARLEMPLMLLSGHRQQKIELPIPANLVDRILNIDWQIEPGQRLAGSTLFERDRLMLNVVNLSKGTALSITAYNPLNQTLSRAMFLVSAFDSGNHLIGQWMLNWKESIGPLQPVKFNAITPVNPAEVSSWDIVGAGITETKP